MRVSIIIVGRNDNYGNDGFLDRVQSCVDNIYSLSPQCGLSGELIFVEWNPPSDRPTMDSAVDWTRATIPTRLMRVSNAIHTTFKRSDTFNLFEYSAKNVGIHRANGEFVLCTNADMLLSKDMISFLATGTLDEGCFYRAIRPPHIVPKNKTDLFFAASGDFLMMSRKQWFNMKGYPEASHNAHVDSSGVFYADQMGLQQVILQQEIVHIEHKCGRAGLYETDWWLWPPKNEHENWGFMGSPEVTEITIK
jgi:hypothetical protein